jgi:hypothetical protein
VDSFGTAGTVVPVAGLTLMVGSSNSGRRMACTVAAGLPGGIVANLALGNAPGMCGVSVVTYVVICSISDSRLSHSAYNPAHMSTIPSSTHFLVFSNVPYGINLTRGIMSRPLKQYRTAIRFTKS